jgi:hypothetical protein
MQSLEQIAESLRKYFSAKSYLDMVDRLVISVPVDVDSMPVDQWAASMREQIKTQYGTALDIDAYGARQHRLAGLSRSVMWVRFVKP